MTYVREITERPPVVTAPGWGAPAYAPAPEPPAPCNFRLPGKYILSTGEELTTREAAEDPRNVHKLTQKLLQRRLTAGQFDPEQLFRSPICKFVIDTGEELTAYQASIDMRNQHGISEESLRRRLTRGGEFLKPEMLWSKQNDSRPRVAYTLTTGEALSAAAAASDSRNVHRLSQTVLRKRMARGGDYLDPQNLWSGQKHANRNKNWGWGQ
jgi:hypothetical protein